MYCVYTKEEALVVHHNDSRINITAFYSLSRVIHCCVEEKAIWRLIKNDHESLRHDIDEDICEQRLPTVMLSDESQVYFNITVYLIENQIILLNMLFICEYAWGFNSIF